MDAARNHTDQKLARFDGHLLAPILITLSAINSSGKDGAALECQFGDRRG
jgi:hypothetical protein